MSPVLKGVIGGAAVVLAGLVIWAVKTAPVPPTDVEVKQQVMTYEGNRITEVNNGRLVWELTADNIEVVAETKVVNLTNVKMSYYTEEGNVMEVSSDVGAYDENTGNIVLKPNVKGNSTDGYELSCNEMNWIAKDSKMVLSGGAVLKRKGDNLMAKADVAEATDEFNKIKLIGNAHISKDVPEDWQ